MFFETQRTVYIQTFYKIDN